MIKTLLSSTVLVAAVVAGAYAQETPAPAHEVLPAPEGAIDAPEPALDEPAAPAEDEEWEMVEFDAVLPDELRGAEIRTAADDQQIGTVSEVVSAQDGIAGVVVEFGGFLGFGHERVMIPVEDVEIFRDGDRFLVRTEVTREALEDMPEYVAD